MGNCSSQPAAPKQQQKSAPSPVNAAKPTNKPAETKPEAKPEVKEEDAQAPAEAVVEEPAAEPKAAPEAPMSVPKEAEDEEKPDTPAQEPEVAPVEETPEEKEEEVVPEPIPEIVEPEPEPEVEPEVVEPEPEVIVSEPFVAEVKVVVLDELAVLVKSVDDADSTAKGATFAKDAVRDTPFAHRVALLAAFSHKHIVQTLQVVSKADDVVVVTEDVPAFTQDAALSEDAARDIFRQVLSAVHYLHAQNVTLGDLGVSSLRSLEDVVKVSVGSVSDADKAADVKGLGSLLYTLLTNEAVSEDAAFPGVSVELKEFITLLLSGDVALEAVLSHEWVAAGGFELAAEESVDASAVEKLESTLTTALAAKEEPVVEEVKVEEVKVEEPPVSKKPSHKELKTKGSFSSDKKRSPVMSAQKPPAEKKVAGTPESKPKVSPTRTTRAAAPTAKSSPAAKPAGARAGVAKPAAKPAAKKTTRK